MAELISQIEGECLQCGRCSEECLLLQEISESPALFVQRGSTATEAFWCFLCGLCEAVCPAALSLKEWFAAARRRAVRDGSVAVTSEYHYLLPDRPHTVMSLYRERYGVKYGVAESQAESKIAFFPGCTMLTYCPEVVNSLYERLTLRYGQVRLYQGCCGLPLAQLGLAERAEAFLNQESAKLVSSGVNQVVLACSNCYYFWRQHMPERGIRLETIYEALAEDEIWLRPLPEEKRLIVAVHDSCPDRREGRFGEAARNSLLAKGYRLTELPRSGQETVCCGSGGQVSHSRPDFSAVMVDSRLEEAQQSGAQILASYCTGCTLNFAKVESHLRICHVLDLLLELDNDYAGRKALAGKMFEGAEGEALWQKLME